MAEPAVNNGASAPQLECVQRISKIPIVELMWNQTTGMYEKVKGSNSVVNWTLSSAEATVHKAIQTAAPVARKFEQPIHKVDETLCKGLNTLEEKVPIMKEKPEQVVSAAKTYVNTTMQPAYEKVEAVKRYGTAFGNYAMASIDATVEMADQYVEYYLPEETSQQLTDGPVTVPDQSIPQRVGKISVKVGRGVYQKIVVQMKTLGTKSEKSLTSLSHLSEMLQMASATVDSAALAARASSLWNQLKTDSEFEDGSEDESGEKVQPGTVAVAGVVARKLIRNVLNICTQAANALPIPPGPLAAQASALPSQLSSRLEMAAEYAKGLYVQLKMYNFHEASDSIKTSMKDQITKIQGVLKDLNAYASQWLHAHNGSTAESTSETPEEQKKKS
ncbi:lipid storage droplets surface-binding protein 1-like isoform X2 [Ischnura elegans]|uniref:lipid storage droplets surface-binding protein 1-like isoform X2 n=1 Tax=Ischnura elegans TaxID=197161 RepID=UPI001ED8735E|nr:lipid storage droplets surface-binding protein 1-like isoform X2 [Ischnura elegans]